MESSDGVTCPPGQYYSPGHEECRDCELICGNQYGGPATVDCQTHCPGYGQSTYATTSVTLPPSFEDDSQPWWIWFLIAFSCTVLVALIIILVVCLKKARYCQKKKCWLQPTEEPASPDAEETGFVTQESNHNGKAVLVVA